jgi:hypothetical protein
MLFFRNQSTAMQIFGVLPCGEGRLPLQAQAAVIRRQDRQVKEAQKLV